MMGGYGRGRREADMKKNGDIKWKWVGIQKHEGIQKHTGPPNERFKAE